jgi:hypothetical protein
MTATITGIEPLDQALDEFCDGDGETWLALTALTIPVAIGLGMDPLAVNDRHSAASREHLRDAWAVLGTVVLCGATTPELVRSAARVARAATAAANAALRLAQLDTTQLDDRAS